MHVSTKTYGHDLGLSCAFRQWKAESHCAQIHGYALAVRLEFEADELNEQNWVMDFGSLKDIKALLVKIFDHKLVVAHDDPLMPMLLQLERAGGAELTVVKATGCEAFALLIFETIEDWLAIKKHAPRVRLRSVEVREHGANSAIYERNKP